MKSKLAIAVLSALALASTAHAAEVYNKDGNKLDLYGKVKGEHDFATHGDKDSNADATYARLGFKGETQIADSVTGFGQFEHQFNASAPEGSQDAGNTRLAFAGLDFGDYGSIDYGRNYGVTYDVGAYTDNLTEFGGDSFQYTDNYLNGRATGVLTYRNKNFFGLVDGLALAAQYQGANESRAWNKANGEGYGFSLQYEIPESGVTVGGAYANSSTTNATGDFTLNGVNLGQYRHALGERAETWAVGTKYAANGLYLATVYGETHNTTPVHLENGDDFLNVYTDKTKNFEAMAAYTFDFGLTPSVGYVESKGELANISGYLTKYVQVGASYNFNKNFAVDAAYQINLLKDDGVGFDTDDHVILGATYQF
ncbi:TPA: porin [Enterobacter hormaechei subsp. xiangfangensis]|nr:porin [Enterobacter hormaechei subsp. xiangfangensis]HAV1890554.1 porin [Enterobacter hormaechei subsp. xiangfangensis]